MTAVCDIIVQRKHNARAEAFTKHLHTAEPGIVSFVDMCMGWGGRARSYLWLESGSFNSNLVVQDDGTRERVVIRFGIPGRYPEAWLEEKIRNEEAAMEFVRQNTTIPVPKVLRRGTANDSPAGLGPFLIMEFMGGTLLTEFIRRNRHDPWDENPSELDPDIDNALLDKIWEQIADFLIQLYRLKLPAIGAISRDPLSKDRWIVSGRPLTFSMAEVVTGAGYPEDQVPQLPFRTSSDYFNAIGEAVLTQLRTHRNLAFTEEQAKEQFISRHRFREMIPSYCVPEHNEGPFTVFCDDLRPANMLADDNGTITAVVDWEFTNAMPPQYSYDPPWWLLLKAPDVWLETDDDKKHFFSEFPARVDQFTQAMERVEARRLAGGEAAEDGPPLSARMRESWTTGRFWFNYMSRKSFDLNMIFWNAVHRAGDDEEARIDIESLEPVLLMKMEQIQQYIDEANRLG